MKKDNLKNQESVKATNYHFKKSDIGIFKIGNLNAISEKLNPKGHIYGFTDGNFSLIDLIYALLKKVGQSDIIICTWSAGIKDSHNIKWMLDTNLIRNIKIITDMSFPSRKKNYSIALDNLFGTENIRMARVHAKFVLIQNEEWNIVVNTSMNLNANKTIENFQVIDDKELFDFMMNYTNIHFDNQKSGFDVKFSEVQKSYKLFFNENLEPQTDWWKF